METKMTSRVLATSDRTAMAYIGVGVTDPYGAEEVFPAAPHDGEDARQKQRVVLAGNVPREDEKPTAPRRGNEIPQKLSS